MENEGLGKAEKERLELCKALEKELKYSRFIHTMGVAFTATALAERYGADAKKAELAGMLHDCAKYYSTEKMVSLCEKAGLPISPMERTSGALLHSKAGSVLAHTKYDVDDLEVLDAIRYHTTGRPGMTLLEKIIFISDYIEPGRMEAPNLSEVRKLAYEDIDQALLKILKDTLSYLHSTDKEIDPMTQETYDYYVTHGSHVKED